MDVINKELEKIILFTSATLEAINKFDEKCYFDCPLCGEKAYAIKNSYTGHIKCICENCKTSIIQ